MRIPWHGPRGGAPSITHGELVRMQAGRKEREANTLIHHDCDGILERRAYREAGPIQYFGDALHHDLYCSKCCPRATDPAVTTFPTEYKTGMVAERRTKTAESVAGKGAKAAPDW